VAGAGAERLRQVSQACLNYGVRVQYSVFECRIDAVQWVTLKARLLQIHDGEKDSLRFYFMCEADARRAEMHGVRKAINPTGILVVD